MFYVYIIKNPVNRFYIGHTGNLDSRLQMHNKNRVKSTKLKGTWEFATFIELPSRSEAMKLESYLKSLKNSRKAIDFIQSLKTKN